nr:MAG TPA: hypothetical protein [Caudoviricetes sp.]
MNEVIVAILGGSAGAAVINGAFKLIELAANRKAQKDDKAEAKADNDRLQDGDIAEIKEDIKVIKESISALEKSNADLIVGEREALGDRIKHLCLKYIEQGFVWADDLADLVRMHEVYHDKLKGNGFYDDLMTKVRELPVSVKERKVQK